MMGGLFQVSSLSLTEREREMQVLRKAFKRVTALIEILPMTETVIEGDLSWLSFLKGTLVCHNDRLQLLASEVDCSISEVPPFSKMFFYRRWND